MNIKKIVLLTTTVFGCVTLAMQEEKRKCPPIKELSCKEILSILVTGKNPCGYSYKEIKDKQFWCDDPMYSTGCSEAFLEQKQKEIDQFRCNRRLRDQEDHDQEDPERDSWGREIHDRQGW